MAWQGMPLNHREHLPVLLQCLSTHNAIAWTRVDGFSISEPSGMPVRRHQG